MPENLPETLGELKPEEISDLIAAAELTISKQHSGPLPPAEEISLYEQTLPGAAERIFAYMEREQAFRHEQQSREQGSLTRETSRGQLYAFLIMAGCVGAAASSFIVGAHPTVTIAFLSVPVISVVKAFVEGRSKL